MNSEGNDTGWALGCLALVIIVLVCLGLITGEIQFKNHDNKANPCDESTSTACIQYRYEQCMATELFTHAECVQIIGSK